MCCLPYVKDSNSKAIHNSGLKERFPIVGCLPYVKDSNSKAIHNILNLQTIL